MYIAVPANAHGGPEPASVLTLEPLLAFARECRPDALALMPPVGPDDQPNGAALYAMHDRLEQDGFRVIGGCLEVPPDAPVEDPGWQIQNLFEARALVAALGEGGVCLLTLAWAADAASPGGRRALEEFLVRLLEEAERAPVAVALQAELLPEGLLELLDALPSRCLGACLDAAQAAGARAGELLEALGERLFAVRALHGAAVRPEALKALRRAAFNGPICITGLNSPVEYARAVGYFRGLEAGAPPLERSDG
jgi:sugar phosphate isomerase/epimerase